jgi:RNA polymerase sigma-70 factor (ECF subfamily)
MGRTGDTSLGTGGSAFPLTTMGLVAGLRGAAAPDARRAALESLAARYWKPVYLYIRMAWSKPNEDAKDLTQAFFAWLFESDALGRYVPERGSFRKFLKVLLAHFVSNEERALSRLKRGGAVGFLRLDDDAAQLEAVLADPNAKDPEAAFTRAWAIEVTRHAVERVRTSFRARGRDRQFRVFERLHFTPAEDRPTYGVLARELGLKETDVGNYLFAVREALRDEIRAELTRTTTDDEELQAEWNALFGE